MSKQRTTGVNTTNKSYQYHTQSHVILTTEQCYFDTEIMLF